MKHLLEVSGVVTKRKLRRIEILDENTLKNKSSKYGEFYEALLAGKFRNDRDAATLLYACSPTDDRYRQLKSRFRKRLLNTLFFLDVNLPSSSNYERASYACNKDWALVKILLSNNAPGAAADLAQSTLQTALKFQFADMVVNCARILRANAAQNGDLAAFEQYDQHIRHFARVLDAEMQAEAICQFVQLQHTGKSTADNLAQETFEAQYQTLVQLNDRFESPVLRCNLYLVQVCRAEIQGQWPQVIDACRQAEQYLNQHPVFFQQAKQEILLLKKTNAYLQLRDYTAGKPEGERALQQIGEGSAVWFQVLELYFLLSLHTEHFTAAPALYARAIQHTRFRKLSLADREKWQLYGLYLDYLADNQLLNGAYQPQLSPGVRLHTEPTTNGRKEQRMFVIHQLIVQSLLSLNRRQYATASKRIERLAHFAGKQMKSGAYTRTLYFIQMLRLLAKADFVETALQNAHKFHHALLETPPQAGPAAQEWEVVPYELLWKMMLKKAEVAEMAFIGDHLPRRSASEDTRKG